ncbi:unnamed protein product [Aureobasidium mustum]|uniref:Uncharacterized protein n=1 Tax=Aureobasidium mustum TaxID=2773714 RepID=A0A9N8JQW3_9PEZI|nr:unnamed protein product [Aureobasidium mustum]
MSTNKSATSILYHILEPRYNNSIGLAAAWADDYAHTPSGAFSYQWHWIDSADNPPHYCNVYYHRDCSEGGFPNTTIQPFFKHLVSRIQEDDFSIPSSEWIACSDPSRPLECALSWARDSNALNCDYVFSRAVKDVDLATSGYATGAFPIVELQTSKAILRIATWLNRLVAADHDREGGVVLQTEPGSL